MNPSELDALYAFLVAIGVAALLTPLTMRLARRVGAVDQPRERGLSDRETPLLGGLAMLAAAAFAGALWLPHTKPYPGILAAAALITLVGALDDRFDFNPAVKLIGQIAAAVVAVALFAIQERRSPEPMISLELWGRRPIAAANGASLLSGMVMIGLTTFLPVFVQGVMQKSPLIAGFALSAMVLGWPVGATIGVRGFRRFGVRAVLRTGGALVPVGASVFVLLSADSSPVAAGLGSLIVGLGMGLLSSASIILIQEIVDWSERGSVTASLLFARNLGSTFGATIFGAVLNMGLVHSSRPIHLKHGV